MSTFTDNIRKARSHLVFLVGLGLAFGLVISLELWEPEEKLMHQALKQVKEPIMNVAEDGSKVMIRPVIEASEDRPDLLEPRQLTALERKWAKIAWKYFENNYQEETGLVNSTDNYPSATLWDLSSYLLGMISAHRLELVSDEVFYKRTAKLLDSLAKIELFDGTLPNKVYHTGTLAMVDYANQPTDDGIGWSALDIARFLVPFEILSRHYPAFTSSLQRVTDRWDLAAMFDDGEMIGARLAGSHKVEGEETHTPESDVMMVERVQEGRLGYEEYAAKAALLDGWDASRAVLYDSNMKFISILGVDIATDARDPKIYHGHNYVVTEPYVLDGIEFGWDAVSAELAWRVHEVQRLRYETTGKLTAVSEDNIDQAPHFVYNTIFTDGETWNTITEDGADASEFSTISTKAVFGLHMLFESDYTQKLINRMHTVHDPERGWYSGVYEKTEAVNAIITANTNGIILETLAFRELGPALKFKSTQRIQVAEAE